ncbi:MAG: hemin uptake protein HemP [Nitrosomonas sp.]|nr:hemin uptake protein HemP [Nitrosomonas sp.]MCW5607357.1 hemin uptake protein HemP [Nitrosomonas sp.]
MRHFVTKIQASTVHCLEKRLPVASDQSSVLDSDALFTNNAVVFIMHHGERYLLRRTRNDKLILTK